MSNDKKNEIIENLKKSYWMEIETVMNYLANSVHLDGIRAEEVKEKLSVEVADELGHATRLAKRLKELGAAVPGSLEFNAEQKTMQPPEDTTDMYAIVKGVVDAETGAIEQYKKIIRLCDGVDYVTQDLCIGLQADEEEHLVIFQGYLKALDKDRK
ncbi:MAG: ferritin-like domain-containing protein [Bacteroidia bacterium]